MIAGVYDVVIAAGVESMTRVPMGSSLASGGIPFTYRMNERYAEQGGLVMQGISAELIAEQWHLSREDLDAFSADSHQKALRAQKEGRFDREIIEVVTPEGIAVTLDEGIRPDSTVESLAKLKPAFKTDGCITAGNSSQITDGAAAVLVMSERRAAQLGLTPRARFHEFALAGVDPVTMLTGPIPATRKILERSGQVIDDMDLVEINEAFASVVLAWERELHPDMDRVNVNGGGHCSGPPPRVLGSPAPHHSPLRVGADWWPIRATDDV